MTNHEIFGKSGMRIAENTVVYLGVKNVLL